MALTIIYPIDSKILWFYFPQVTPDGLQQHSNVVSELCVVLCRRNLCPDCGCYLSAEGFPFCSSHMLCLDDARFLSPSVTQFRWAAERSAAQRSRGTVGGRREPATIEEPQRSTPRLTMLQPSEER